MILAACYIAVEYFNGMLKFITSFCVLFFYILHRIQTIMDHVSICK